MEDKMRAVLEQYIEGAITFIELMNYFISVVDRSEAKAFLESIQ